MDFALKTPCVPRTRKLSLESKEAVPPCKRFKRSKGVPKWIPSPGDDALGSQHGNVARQPQVVHAVHTFALLGLFCECSVIASLLQYYSTITLILVSYSMSILWQLYEGSMSFL